MSEPQETRKPNRFRISSIIIAVAMICFMLSPLFSSVQGDALEGSGYANTSDTIGVTELFNMDFEKESLGAFTKFGWYSGFGEVNRTVEIATLNSSKTLRFNETYATSTQLKGSTIFGQKLDRFNLSFRWYPDTARAATIHLRLLYNSWMIDDYFCAISFNAGEEHQSRLYLNGSSPFQTDGQWHLIRVDVNTPSGTYSIYIDGVFQATVSVTPRLSVYGIGILIDPLEYPNRWVNWYFDDFIVTIPKHKVQPILDPYNNQSNFDFILDDGVVTAYTTVLPLLEPHNFTATVAITTDWIGAGGRLTWAQVNDLAKNKSWEIAAHSVNHAVGLPLEMLTDQLVKSKAYIEANVSGIDVQMYVWPGTGTSLVNDTLAHQYYDIVRGYQGSWDLDCYGWFAGNDAAYTAYYMSCGLSYSKHGHVDFYTHNVWTGAQGGGNYDLATSVFHLFVNESVERGIQIGTSNLYVPYRNWKTANVSGTVDSFSLSHLRDYADSKTWLQIAQADVYGIGEYYLTSSISYAHLTVGNWIRMMTVQSATPMFLNMSRWSPTNSNVVAQWTASSSASDVTFTLSGLESGRMYRLYIDGNQDALLTASGSGVISFTYSGPWSEHQFEIVATSITGSISPLVSLIFIMFAVGVVVGVIVEGTYSLRKKEMLNSQEMIKSVITMVIYIVIGIASLGVLYSIVA